MVFLFSVEEEEKKEAEEEEEEEEERALFEEVTALIDLLKEFVEFVEFF
jgi:hypothetical protein